MLKQSVISWAKSYFYVGIGLEALQPLDNFSEEVITSTMQRAFYTPITKLFKLEADIDFEKDKNARDTYRILLTMLPQANYVLNELAAIGNLIDMDVNTIVEEFKRGKTEEVYIAAGNDKVFKAFHKSGKLIGMYPNSPRLVHLGSSKYLRSKSELLSDLANRDPFYLNDFCVKALRLAVQNDCIAEHNLRTSVKMVPSNGTFVTKSINALYPELPSYGVRHLISSLPDALVQDNGGNVYMAALEFAKESSDYKRCIDELQALCNTVTAREVTEEDVLKYISTQYGIDANNLDEIIRPTSKTLYSSAYLLDSDSKTMTAEEFIEAVNAGQDDATGTIDEIIVAYCKEENISLECSIQQLIDSFDGAIVSPKTLTDELIELKASKSDVPNFGETTVDELISGTDHVHKDDTAVAWDLLRSLPTLSDNVKPLLYKAIYEKEQLSLPSVESVIRDADIPSDIKERLMNCIVNEEEFEYPEPIDEQITTALIRKGLPRATVTSIVSTGSIPVDESKVSLTELGYTEEQVEAIKSGNLSSMQTEADLKDDLGYNMGYSLLADARRTLLAKDDYNTRKDITSITYVFLRLMGINKQMEEEVIGYLKEKQGESPDYVKAYFDKALQFYDK